MPEPPGAALRRALETARARGFLGPDDPQRHLDHAAAFAVAVEARVGAAGPASFLDLGSGAGVPGLALVARWPTARATLVDAMRRRCDFARSTAAELGYADRVDVRCARAEVLGREPDLREQFPVVVARSFGPPAVTAELAASFVAVGGWVVVSEPPEEDTARWDPGGLAELGLGPAERERAAGLGMAVIAKREALSERFPRRTGVPKKRPLW
jgi:16S rRNA (guanine527-N7)-methyltransferase